VAAGPGQGLSAIRYTASSAGRTEGGSFERLEGKMDQMIEAQQDGNLILAEIKGALGSRAG